MSMHSELEKAHEPKDVDVSAAGRGVWLVKVPKYLSDQWKACPNGTDVGKLKISKSKLPSKKPDIVFSTFDLSNHQTNQNSVSGVSTLKPSSSLGGAASIRNHRFLVTNVGQQNLVVMAQNKTDGNGKDPPPGGQDRVSIEGKVLQRAECHPIVDDTYKLLKKQQVQAQNTPQRQIKLLDRVVNSYKPVKDHFNTAEDRKAKKSEKRSRGEKDKVMDTLFNLFEKHQFYSLKDLVLKTRQPVNYLKTILKDICQYNMTAPHKNMWELKPEFRHYKSHEDLPPSSSSTST